jgi:hypothetical protein
MKILVVNGKPLSGKDVFCQTIYEKRGLVFPYSTIDEVKLLATQLGWDGVKDEKGRKFLSDLKDAMTAYNDLPREYVLKQIKQKCELYRSTPEIIDDMIFLIQSRESTDIERWEKENGARSLLIIKKLETTDVTHWRNHADDEVWNHSYHYRLKNFDDLETWKTISLEFIDKIRKEKWESHI